MALSADTPRAYRDTPGPEAALPVQASSTIYAGSACSIDSGGEVGPLSASDAAFAGFARKFADNSSGSAGDINCVVYTEGLIELTITGLDDNNDLNDLVYASDDGSFQLNPTGGVAIGRVFQIVSLSANKAVVLFKSAVHEHAND
jgi:hypothetical protein